MDRSQMEEIKKACIENRDWFIERLKKYVLVETPSDNPELNRTLLKEIASDFEELNLETEIIDSEESGGQLIARGSGEGFHADQLLIGHADTVWPVGTLEEMPWNIDGDVIRGPGVYDMKSGIVMMQLALRVLSGLGMTPALRPVVLITTDEETGSSDSWDLIESMARTVERVYVPEPSMGFDGNLKTRRKGSGRYTITVRGREVHSGIEPENGVSAIVEMAHVIRKLDRMNDYSRGISLNAGLISGGSAVNIVPGKCVIEVDVRVLETDDGEEIDRKIQNLEPELDGAEIVIEGGMRRPPMVQNSRNLALWELAQKCAKSLDIPIGEGLSGGGSDGSITSQYAATLDGLGPVGEGAHSRKEKVLIEQTIERAALLAALISANGLQ
jgi:glutamate carboxypeptidase